LPGLGTTSRLAERSSKADGLQADQRTRSTSWAGSQRRLRPTPGDLGPQGAAAWGAAAPDHPGQDADAPGQSRKHHSPGDQLHWTVYRPIQAGGRPAANARRPPAGQGGQGRRTGRGPTTRQRLQAGYPSILLKKISVTPQGPTFQAVLRTPRGLHGRQVSHVWRGGHVAPPPATGGRRLSQGQSRSSRSGSARTVRAAGSASVHGQLSGVPAWSIVSRFRRPAAARLWVGSGMRMF